VTYFARHSFPFRHLRHSIQVEGLEFKVCGLGLASCQIHMSFCALFFAHCGISFRCLPHKGSGFRD